MINALNSYEYRLSIDSDISDVYKIRNGRLWAVLTNGILLFADLNIKPKPFIKTFPEVNKCETIFVSPDGEFCFIRTKVEHFHIFSKDLIPTLSPIPPGTLIRCATFFYDGQDPKPYIFMGTNLGQVTFLNLNRMIISLSHLPIFLEPATPIDGVSIVQYQNGYLGLSVITQNKIIPFILLPNFSESNLTKARIPQISATSPDRVFCENNLIGILTDQLAFEFIIKNNTSKPRLDQQLTHQIFYTIPEEPAGFYMFGQFMLLFTKSGKIKIFMNGFETEIETFTINNINRFDYDIDTGELYGISNRKVSKVCPNFIEQARSLIAKKFISSKKYKEAASIVVQMKQLSLYEMLKFIGLGNEIRYYLFKFLYEKIQANKEKTKQKVVIAYTTFIYYVRVESSKEKPDVESFVNFSKSLLEEELITIRDIVNTLTEYGWYDPIIYLADPKSSFNFFMQAGQIEKAVQCLTEIKNEDDFYQCLLRIFNSHINDALSAISQLASYDCYKIIPIFMKKESKQFVLSLLDKNQLTTIWLNRIFCLFLAKSDDINKDLVKKFFILHRYSEEYEIQFLTRSMLASRQYLMLADGLMEIQDYLGATMAASKGNSFLAFKLIANIRNPKTQKRCAQRILRSMNSNDTAIVASYLLENYEKSGVEPGLLLEYIPSETIGEKMSNFVQNFGENYTKDSEELHKKIDEALVGCETAEKLVRECEEKAAKLPSMTSCSQCKKSIFTEAGIVYPCSHILHYKCAMELASQIKNEKIDFTADCPMCGFLSIRLIDQPFNKNKEADPWSVDPTKLAALIPLQRKKTVNININLLSSKNEK